MFDAHTAARKAALNADRSRLERENLAIAFTCGFVFACLTIAFFI